MTSGISFSGLASGLDTRAIIDQLVALERIPITQIEAQRTDLRSKLSSIGTFEGLVRDLQTAADGLSTSSSFFAYTVGLSRTDLATISASSDAQPGSHTLTVNATAATDRWAFDAVVDPDAQLATSDGQEVSFEIDGTVVTVPVRVGSSSLNEVAVEIESAAAGLVTTSVVNVGTEASPSYQLVLTSSQSGEDFRISNLSSTVNGLAVDGTGPDGGGNPISRNNITVGNNAVAVIDGLRIERADNDFSDVIEGVTIDLLAAAPGEEMTFTVEPDRATVTAQIEAFTNAYNEVVEFINSQNTFDEEGGAGGDLFGDTLLSDVRARLATTLFNVDSAVVAGDTEGFSTLGLIGISQDNDGLLRIDSSTLESKLGDNILAVADLFVDDDGFDNGGAEVNTPDYYVDTTADSGLAASLSRAIDRILDNSEGPVDEATGERIPLEGLFTARRTALNASVERFDDQIEARERRLVTFEETLVLRFSALEQLIGGLNAQGQALTAALTTLPGAPGN